MKNLPAGMIETCRRQLFRWKLADSSGERLTGGQLLTKALVLRRLLLREVLAEDETNVGVLLPPSNGGAVVNSALALARRVSVNLNYSATSQVLNVCIQKAGIRHVLTTRKVMEKLGLEIDCEVFYLEDLKDKVTTADKLFGAAAAYAAPAGMLSRQLGVDRVDADEPLTIIFTSGSTGEPKGVVLTHRNVGSNVEAIQKTYQLRPDDVILGILPFFHSFGYTVTLWGPVGLHLRGCYHFSPLDARQVGKLAGATGATILLSTPTFLRSYLKRCTPEEFASLEVVIAGAEKLPSALCDAFEQKFGVRPVEGYGATECSPVVAVNVPDARAASGGGELREGSVGKPMVGISAKVVHPESFDPLPTDQEGLLLVTGPNVMQGYLDQPEKTAEVIRDGWYVTGDIARIDAEGFIHITGRESRFSKIGGEMVPHVRVEEEINKFLVEGLGEEADGELIAVVTAVPDTRKGERLIVVHLPTEKTPEQIAEHLGALGLPNLWLPSADSYLQVEELPLLGSGKLDLKLLAKIAAERFAPK
ncbi:MAG: AMP-binding protein [Planctomycetota bacterium]